MDMFFSSDTLPSWCYSEFKPSKEYLMKANRIRLKDGALCGKIPDGMKICCKFDRLPGRVDDFADDCGY
jgi:hypothetical protein